LRIVSDLQQFSGKTWRLETYAASQRSVTAAGITSASDKSRQQRMSSYDVWDRESLPLFDRFSMRS